MIIDCISDLHGFYPELEGGDLLIVAGDLTARDSWQEYDAFDFWMNSLDYKKKIVIAGNHDNFWREATFGSKETAYNQYEYLCDSGTEFEGLKIWGSPWTKTFEGMNPHCKSFTVDTEEELAEKWALIPEDIDILVTHSPPYRIMDLVGQYSLDAENIYAGSKSLRSKVSLSAPKLWIWGHIHESYGVMNYPLCNGSTESLSFKGVTCVNASLVNAHYQPVNKPIRIEL